MALSSLTQVSVDFFAVHLQGKGEPEVSAV
jgi:hypothetical protein